MQHSNNSMAAKCRVGCPFRYIKGIKALATTAAVQVEGEANVECDAAATAAPADSFTLAIPAMEPRRQGRSFV